MAHVHELDQLMMTPRNNIEGCVVRLKIYIQHKFTEITCFGMNRISQVSIFANQYLSKISIRGSLVNFP